MQSKCKICKDPAVMNRNKYSIAHCLSPDCMIGVWELIKQKDMAAKDKAYRAETKRLKSAFYGEEESLSSWTKKTQDAFNAYIRERDKGKPCISCLEYKILQAGHFRGVGACKELRFHMLNCHGQCEECNMGSANVKWRRIERITTEKYKTNLIDRIGLPAVDWLEGPHELPRYRVEDLKNIHWIYKQLLRIEKCD